MQLQNEGWGGGEGDVTSLSMAEQFRELEAK